MTESESDPQLLSNSHPESQAEDDRTVFVPHPIAVNNNCDLETIANGISSGRFKQIIVATGAGISVSAGIPDFRSPGSGVYSKLKDLGLPNPESVFDLRYFMRYPKPFCSLAKELFPGNFLPTKAHLFSVLLERKGILLRHYTQNIDTLERQAGLSSDLLVEAHGSFATVKCLSCGQATPLEDYKKVIFDNKIPRCKIPSEPIPTYSSSAFQPVSLAKGQTQSYQVNSESSTDIDSIVDGVAKLGISENVPHATQCSTDNSVATVDASSCERNSTLGCEDGKTKQKQNTKSPAAAVVPLCGGLLKPGITFFGESLSDRFFILCRQDFVKADLLIIMGTSLKVMPFASLVTLCKPTCHRLLFNREAVSIFRTKRSSLNKRNFSNNEGNSSYTNSDSDSNREESSDSDCSSSSDSELENIRGSSYRFSKTKDVFIKGDCDNSVERLCSLLGWKEELDDMHSGFLKKRENGSLECVESTNNTPSSGNRKEEEGLVNTPNPEKYSEKQKPDVSS
eukprot:GHVQ01038453.1.p1 GENE.GHVQ01038453.1~~GHVQ01038453.1.p1  ORF type:complete len:510 (+),score=68.19 GHVQ01038453.1:125-1654(+)